MSLATPMALRMQIIADRKTGMTLREVSLKHKVHINTVKTLWNHYKSEGESGLKTRYDRSGKKMPAATDFHFQKVCEMKRDHESWGAGKIIDELGRRYPEEEWPTPRTAQIWFHHGGVAKPREKHPNGVTQWGKAPHDVWQIDAKERMLLDEHQPCCWLNIKDEKTGAIIDPPLFPL